MTWEKIFEIFTEPLVLLLLFGLGIFNWYYQKKKERELELEKLSYSNKQNALKSIWALMRYFSKIPTKDSVMYPVGKDYFFRLAEAQQFIGAVEKAFFTDGHGLYLNPTIKKPLFQIRDMIEKLAWDHKNTQETEDFKIEKEIGKKIFQLRNELNNHLRNSI